MSLSYANTPVYIGHPNAAHVNTGFTGSIQYIPALRADVSLDASSKPKRNLGVDVVSTDQLTFDSALGATISVESVIQRDLSDPFGFLSGTTGIQQSYVPIQIGENMYQKCYPQDVSINIQPFLPVTLKTNFVCLEVPADTQVSGDSKVLADTTGIPINPDLFVYGHTCNVSDGSNLLNDVNSQISFTRRYDRSPVYTLGSMNPTSMLLNGVEEELSISSTGLEDFINLSGQEVAGGTISVSLQDVDNEMNGVLVEMITLPIGSRLISQGYGAVGGDALQTSARFRNIIL